MLVGGSLMIQNDSAGMAPRPYAKLDISGRCYVNGQLQ